MNTSLVVREFSEDRYLVMATRKGIIKKSVLSAYSHPRAGGIIAIRLDDKDGLVGVEITDGDGERIASTVGKMGFTPIRGSSSRSWRPSQTSSRAPSREPGRKG
mgnify:CR=1 FL=1